MCIHITTAFKLAPTMPCIALIKGLGKLHLRAIETDDLVESSKLTNRLIYELTAVSLASYTTDFLTTTSLHICS